MTAWSINRLAARAVAHRTELTPAERLELLRLLGLVDERRRITPDDCRVYGLPTLEVARDGEDNLSKRDPAACPPAGLAHLAPAVQQPKPQKRVEPVKVTTPAKRVRPSRAKPGSTRRQVAPCGTRSGASRHYKAKEPLCEPCRDAHKAYQRDRYARRRDANPPSRRKVAECGTLAGYRAHQRKGEPRCRPCKDAANVYMRNRYAARREAS